MSRDEAAGDYTLQVDPQADGTSSVLLLGPVGVPVDLHRIGLSEDVHDAIQHTPPGKPIQASVVDAEGLDAIRERVKGMSEERAEILADVTVPPGYVIEHGWTGGGAYQDDGWWADLDEDDDRGCPWPGQVVALRMLVADGPERGKVVASGDAAGQSSEYGGGTAMFNIFVDEDHRRRGIATALYDAAGIALGERLRPYGGGNEGGAIVGFWEARGTDTGMEP